MIALVSPGLYKAVRYSWCFGHDFQAIASMYAITPGLAKAIVTDAVEVSLFGTRGNRIA